MPINNNNNLNSLENLDKKVKSLDRFLSVEEGKREKLRELLLEAEEKSKNLGDNIELLDKVSLLFQKTSEFAREQAKIQIETIVSNCLQFVFESDIKFRIELEELRGKASAEFYVINQIDGIEIKTKPELSRGGGVVDIVSLALRIAFLQINRPRIDGPLILDEPAKHVSEEYIFNIGDFLKQSSELFSRQIIMITHNNHLSALGDSSFHVDLKGSTSFVTKSEI